MHSTNFVDTLVTVSTDCPVSSGTVPQKPETIAGLQYRLLSERPYALTSDDLLFEVHTLRNPGTSRAEFFATPHPCLRTSPLVKQFGWGIHHDSEGRIALVGAESADYRKLVDEPTITKTPGMRSKRA
jgi:hypothetical protein